MKQTNKNNHNLQFLSVKNKMRDLWRSRIVASLQNGTQIVPFGFVEMGVNTECYSHIFVA